MSTANMNGIDLYYELVGEGDPILMMHGGLGLDHTYFRPWFDQLADSAQLIYYDHRGNGRSERPKNYDSLTIDQLVDDAVALLDHLGLEKVTLFGHSYGGFIGQMFAAKHQDRLSRAIFANTVPVFDYQPQPSGTNEQLAAFGAAFTRPMENDDDWRSTWGTLWQMYFKSYDASIGNQIDASTHYSAAAWNASSAALATFNTLPYLGNIKTPSLVISGAHDFICPAEHGGKRISSLLPNAELKVFAESAHYPFIEQENAFFTALRAWMR